MLKRPSKSKRIIRRNMFFLLWLMLHPAVSYGADSMEFRLTNRGNTIDVCLVNHSTSEQLINARFQYYSLGDYYFKIVDEKGTDYPIRFKLKGITLSKDHYVHIEPRNSLCVQQSHYRVQKNHGLPPGKYFVMGYYEDRWLLFDNAFTGKLISNTIVLF